MPADPLRALRHTVENTAARAIDDAGIIAILRGEGGDEAQLRAVFEDNSLHALARAGAAHGIPLATILRAYTSAREHSLCNPELDRLLADPW